MLFTKYLKLYGEMSQISVNNETIKPINATINMCHFCFDKAVPLNKWNNHANVTNLRLSQP